MSGDTVIGAVCGQTITEICLRDFTSLTFSRRKLKVELYIFFADVNEMTSGNKIHLEHTKTPCDHSESEDYIRVLVLN